MTTTITATVLFTDLVSSGEPTGRLTPTDTEQDRAAHIGLVRHTVRAHGAISDVEFGNGVRATFASATQALDAAVALQQAVHRAVPRLAMRVGLSTGDIVTGDEKVRGAAVDQARQLCAAAQASTILASSAVEFLAGTSARHTLRSRGLVRLPGILQPLEVCEAAWEPGDLAPLRIVLADDAAVIREGIAALLRDAGMIVAATVGDADALVAAVAEHSPDVAITDIRMPPTHQLEGLEAALKIRSTHPAIAVLVLSQHIETRSAVDLLNHGARGVGYLLKERIGDVNELTDALRHLAAGGSIIDPEVVARLVDRSRSTDPLAPLTTRERDVLSLMAEGRTNQAIACRLHLNPKTIESHVRSIFTKLGLEPEPDDHRRVLAVITFLRADPTPPGP
jgi:DNA-binding NarL/FixJ family response regulator/class 3 adenylate cyclase